MAVEVKNANEVRLLEELVRLYLNKHYKLDLRPAQWEALRFFASTPNARLSDFASWRKSTIGTTSTTVSQLVERGLLAREGERNVNLRLTDDGENLMKHDPLRDFGETLQTLPEHERTVFRDTLETVLDQIAR